MLEPETGRVVFETPEFLAEEELWTDDTSEDHTGWHCVSTDPFPCPADGCGFVAEFMTAAHMILVWEERDDPNLLRHAQRAMRSAGIRGSSSTSPASGRARRTTPGKRPGGRCTASGSELRQLPAGIARRGGRAVPGRCGDARARAAGGSGRTRVRAAPQARALRERRRNHDTCLRRRRRGIRGAPAPAGGGGGPAAEHGAAILASGTHPTAGGAEQPVNDEPLYREIATQLGPALERQFVCGLHVHVAVSDEESCLCALEGILPALPDVLALSANSPFVDGADSGLRSSRADALAGLPSGGAPPVFRTWADWKTRTAGVDYRRLHWMSGRTRTTGRSRSASPISRPTFAGRRPSQG